ncbi:MAG: hypothetical protein LBP89_00570 [Helicobacteraceae bacterium]|nr:hypothetical protein [Helicobacteraceae bacterium]
MPLPSIFTFTPPPPPPLTERRTCLLFSGFIFFLVFLIGCGDGSGGDSSGNSNAGSNLWCPSISTGNGGNGGVESYDSFPLFDTSGYRVRNSTATLRYHVIDSDEADALRNRLSDYTNVLGQGTYYQKCNLERGMHAEAVFYSDAAEYALELKLFGNGDFIPNLDKFRYVFGEINAAPGFYYVIRTYDDDIQAKINDYVESAKANNYSCNSASCRDLSAGIAARWFNYFRGYVDWHVDYDGE